MIAGAFRNTGALGAWRSLVARTVRVGEVPGSNPGAPIFQADRNTSGPEGHEDAGRRSGRGVTTPEPLAVTARFFELVVSSRDSAAISELVDPEAVWYGTRGGLDQDRVVRGPAQWLEYIGEIQGTWEGLEIEVERAIEVGDRVVALTRETARTRDGALEVRSETAVVLRIREGRIVEARGYLDRDEALRAAGATN